MGLAALDDQESPVAVVFDFMGPACTRGRVIDCGCELRLDELKGHAKTISRGRVNCDSKKAPTEPIRGHGRASPRGDTALEKRCVEFTAGVRLSKSRYL